MVETKFHKTDDGQKTSFFEVIVDKNRKNSPGVVFLSGLKSDKEGTKAIFLSQWAEKNKRDFLRFDYRGHGTSSGNYEDASISDWLEDTKKIIIQALTSGPQILVGSSLGGWISFLLRGYTLKRLQNNWHCCSSDFTTQYAFNNLSEDKDKSLKLLEAFSILSTPKNF